MTRHWVIGNGASLKDTPLHLLKDEITWGMNAVHFSGFKPKNYICVDVNEKDEKWQDTIERHLDCEKVFLRDWGYSADNIRLINNCEHFGYAADNYMKRAESWHLPKLCTAFGTMNIALQLAYLDDATEICLLGCDLFTGENDHVSDEYPAFADWQVRNEIEKHIHRVAARSCPVPIYNCTIGGGLEVHKRKDIKDVLEHS